MSKVETTGSGARRFLTTLMAVLLALSMLPLTALASIQPAYAAGPEDETLTVKLTIENTTYKDTEAAWTGTLLSDYAVEVPAGTNITYAIVTACMEQGISLRGFADSPAYIDRVGGLAAFDGGQLSGWMVTLNDWFINESIDNFTLEDGDTIRFMYTCDLGLDLGGSWDSTDTGIKALSVSSGVLSPAFAKATGAYTLTYPAGIGTAEVKIAPTAANKFYQVRVGQNGEAWEGVRYGARTLTVQNGDTITVRSGDTAWPTMVSEAFSPTTYTITVRIPAVNEPNLVASGNCGVGGTSDSSVRWAFYDNGLFTITGEGAMYQVTMQASVPWASYRNQIKNAVISKGVTTMTYAGFFQATKLESITFENPIPPTSLGLTPGYTFFSLPTTGTIYCRMDAVDTYTTWKNDFNNFRATPMPFTNWTVVGFEVDYRTALNEAVTAAESKYQIDYTTISWGDLETALAVAKAVAADSEAQSSEIVTATNDLLDAIDALVTIQADFAYLNQVITFAGTLSSANFSTSKWNGIQTALTKANAVASDTSALQSAVDAAATALLTAMYDSIAISPAIIYPGDTVTLTLGASYQGPVYKAPSGPGTFLIISSSVGFDTDIPGLATARNSSATSGTITFTVPAGTNPENYQLANPTAIIDYAFRISGGNMVVSAGSMTIKLDDFSDSANYNLAVPDTIAITVSPYTKAELAAAIAEASIYTEANYYPNTWATLQNALVAADTLMAAENPSSPGIHQAIKDLKAAVAGLVLLPYKVSFLVTPEDAQVTVTDSKNAKVTPNSNGSYTLAAGVTYNYSASTDGLSTFKSTVTPTSDNLLVTINLRDQTALDTAITTASAKTQANFSTESWAALTTALAAAQAVAVSSSSTQGDCDDATAVLVGALASLELIKSYQVTAPTGATVQILVYSNAYAPTDVPVVKTVDNGDGTSVWLYEPVVVPSAYTSAVTYRVSMPGKVTKAGFGLPNSSGGSGAMTVTLDDGDPKDPVTTYTAAHQDDYNMFMSAPASHQVQLAVGETYKLRLYRMGWQIVANDVSAGTIEPDFNFTILSGEDVVSLSSPDNINPNWMNLTGLKSGVAVIEVDYDAIDILGSYQSLIRYGASDPYRKGVIIVTVGEGQNTDVSIQVQRPYSGAFASWDADYDTWYMLSGSQQIDVQVAQNSNGSAISGAEVTAWNPDVPGSLQTVTDGCITIYPGNNILKTVVNGQEYYQVVKGYQTVLTATLASGEDAASRPLQVGDKITIRFSGIAYPVPKMSRIYNPMSFDNYVDYSKTITVTQSIIDSGFITTSNGLPSFWMGYASAGAHRAITDEGVGGGPGGASGFSYTGSVIPAVPLDYFVNGGEDPLALALAKAAKTLLVNALLDGLIEADYTPESWANLQIVIASTLAVIDEASTVAEVEAIELPDLASILVLIPAGPDEPLTVTLNVAIVGGGFPMIGYTVEVAPGLSESFGYTDDYAGTRVTTLDALVAAHIALYGEGALSSKLTLGSSGMVTKAFGVSSSNYLQFVNGAAPGDGDYSTYYAGDPAASQLGYGVSQATLTEGDTVQFVMMDPYWYGMDYVSWFEQGGEPVSSVTVTANQPFTLTLKGYMSYYVNCEPAAMLNAAEGLDGVVVSTVSLLALEHYSTGSFGTALGLTDSNGDISLCFANPGTYIVSAYAEDPDLDFPVISPWLVVTVVDDPGAALAAAKLLKAADINAITSGLNESDYTLASWAALATAIATALAEVDAATTVTEVEAVVVPDASSILVLRPAYGDAGSGDLNGDGIVDMSEALRVAQVVVGGGMALSTGQFEAADMDGDGLLTMADVVLIMRRAAGLS